MKVICIKCGLCCRLGDAVCKRLKKNLCTIYETRPDVCRAETVYELFYKDKMTEEQYVKFNLECCIEIARKAGKKEIVKKLTIIQGKLQ